MTTKNKYRVVNFTDPSDGREYLGSLADIGQMLIAVYGDKATHDNTEPWVTLDDDGNTRPKHFTRTEWIQWVSVAIDQPKKHVANGLSTPTAEAKQIRSATFESLEKFSASRNETLVAKKWVGPWGMVDAIIFDQEKRLIGQQITPTDLGNYLGARRMAIPSPLTAANVHAFAREKKLAPSSFGVRFLAVKVDPSHHHPSPPAPSQQTPTPGQGVGL